MIFVEECDRMLQLMKLNGLSVTFIVFVQLFKIRVGENFSKVKNLE